MKTTAKRTVIRSLTALLVLAPGLMATPQGLEEKYEEKLAKRFVRFGGWETDYDAARERAKQEDKLLFVYFSRSYSP